MKIDNSLIWKVVGMAVALIFAGLFLQTAIDGLDTAIHMIPPV